MELLIRIADKHPVVAALYESASQRGDVIAACPDGWAWSQAERENPDWIIVTADITDIEAGALLEGFRSGEPRFRRRLGVDPTGLQSGAVLAREQLMKRVF
jgi:hypothetical protein